jgi:hypothetical protein
MKALVAQQLSPPVRYPLSEGRAAVQGLADGEVRGRSCWSRDERLREEPMTVMSACAKNR